MTLPITFGPLAGPIPTSDLDTNFAAVGAMGVIYCSATGTNTLALTAIGNQAVANAYAQGFKAQFVAANSNTGATSANVNTLGALGVYKDTVLGPVVCAGGEIISGCAYQLWYDPALSSGAGGFHLVSAGGTGTGGGSSGGGAWQFTAQASASGTSMQFLTGIVAATDLYEIDIDNVVCNTTGASLQLQFSTDAGSTWIATNYTYVTLFAANAVTVGTGGSTSATAIQVGPMASGAPSSGYFRIDGTQLASGRTQVMGQFTLVSGDSATYVMQLAGSHTNTAAINAFQIIPSTGSFTSGTAFLYAVQNTNATGSGGGTGFTTAGVVGDARNFVCSRATTTTLTITASEAIVKLAPGSSAWLVANLSKTLNFGTTGINGLDTGAIAASKFYGIYIIYNPTSNLFNTLASLNLTTPTTLPSGYTAYALMAVVPTNSSAQIRAGYNAFGRTCSFQEINIVTGHATVSSLASLSVAAAVPSIAKSVNGVMGNTSGIVSGYTTIGVASDASGTGAQNEVPVATGSTIFSPYHSCAAFMNLQLITPQTIYWAGAASDGSSTLRLGVTGYTI